MATRKVAPKQADDEILPTPIDEDEPDDDFSFSSSPESKPTTGQELYRALVESGFIGGWKDRTDIGDNLEYARLLRKRASERLRGT
jgi:hypothetical protein